jgi:ABC-2 type transport system permease protein
MTDVSPNATTHAFTPEAFGGLLSLFFRTQATRARVASLAALGVVLVVVAVALNASDLVDEADAATDYVNSAGLSLLVPIAALVFASSAFGDLRDDNTFVYLWVRPVKPLGIVLAAEVAAVLVVLPVTIVPLALAAYIIAGTGTAVAATCAAVFVAVLAYTSLFTFVGLLVSRPLVWGLAYVLLWEGFVAQAGKTASRVAVRAYTRSVLAELSDTTLELGTVSLPWSWVVPLVVAAVGVGLASWRFAHQDVA